jgi:transposase
MQKLNDLSRSLAPLKPDGTLIAVIEMSQSSWLVAGNVPGVERPAVEEARCRRDHIVKATASMARGS